MHVGQLGPRSAFSRECNFMWSEISSKLFPSVRRSVVVVVPSLQKFYACEGEGDLAFWERVNPPKLAALNL